LPAIPLPRAEPGVWFAIVWRSWWPGLWPQAGPHRAGQYHQSRCCLYQRAQSRVDWLSGRLACRRLRSVWPSGQDKDIRAAVEAELDFDPLVNATDITVRNLNGDVALNGTVPSYPQSLAASSAAQRVDGVKNVHNHLEVVLPPGDYRDDAML